MSIMVQPLQRSEAAVQQILAFEDLYSLLNTTRRATSKGGPMPNPADHSWSPNLAAPLSGLLQFPALLLPGTALGASSSCATASAALPSLISPALPTLNDAIKHIAGAKNWWQVALGVAGTLGAGLLLLERVNPLGSALGEKADGGLAAMETPPAGAALADAAWR
jgi:hypothetical protein